MTEFRPTFATRFGIVMTFIGVAVGLGNVWRFPYMAAAFGGGAFLLLYLLLLVAFGIPALMAELTLGRMTRRGTMGAFHRIGLPGGRAVSWLLLVTVFMATSYYVVIVGWVLRYALQAASGRIGAVEPQAFFDAVLGGVTGQLIPAAVVLALAAVVLALGVTKGVERVSRAGMPLLFLLLLVLIGRVASLPGAGEGLAFYLLPDVGRIDAGVVAAALGQVFFSMALGGTFLLTYASYLPESVNLRTTAITIGVGETLAAVLAGFVIVPAAVVFGLELSSGPPLTFVTAPAIFAAMPQGSVFATIFFALLFFAAFLSSVAAIEVLVAALADEFGWRRSRAVGVTCAALLVAGIPSMRSLDFILKSDLFWGSVMQPVGSALTLIGLAWVVGLGRALDAVNAGNRDRPLGRLWFYWIKYAVPAGIATILAFGLRDLFRGFLAS